MGVFNNGYFIPPVQLLDVFNNRCFILPVQLWTCLTMDVSSHLHNCGRVGNILPVKHLQSMVAEEKMVWLFLFLYMSFNRAGLETFVQLYATTWYEYKRRSVFSGKATRDNFGLKTRCYCGSECPALSFTPFCILTRDNFGLKKSFRGCPALSFTPYYSTFIQ